jgi:hypothetical protein
MNKLSQLTPGAYKKLSLSNYFSKDLLDIKWIPKFTRKRKLEDKDYNKKFNDFENY